MRRIVPVDPVKGVKTNEKSQFEEKSEEDEPDGEASIKKFIEISCYKLRNLMVANLLNRSLEGMDEAKNLVVNCEKVPLWRGRPRKEIAKEKDVNATLPGLSAEKLEQSKISPKDVPSYGEDSLPDCDVMQLRRSSFYSLISGNVRTNMENYLDGRKPENSFILPSKRRRRVARNGFLLHHGDNCPDDPESPYKFHLAAQVLLKFNRRRSKLTPKEERTKNLLSYLKLSPKRSIRIGKGHINKNSNTKCPEIHKSEPKQDSSTFSGDWACGVCGQVEYSFWDMVTHKGKHPGVVVTHVELPVTQEPPASVVRKGPSLENAQVPFISQACTKCAATFNSPSDLHRHIFECAGNSSWLGEKITIKKKSRRRRRNKRRLSNTPKKSKKPETCKMATCYTCAFCGREFKTEGWLKKHVSTHPLPVSIPLDKLPFPLPVRASTRKCIAMITNENTHNSQAIPGPSPFTSQGPWFKKYGIKRKPLGPNESLAFEEVVVKSKFDDNGRPVKKVVQVITISDDDKDNESQDEEESTVNIVIRGTSSILDVGGLTRSESPPPSLKEPRKRMTRTRSHK